jgi:FixJ family two-component response regulator
MSALGQKRTQDCGRLRTIAEREAVSRLVNGLTVREREVMALVVQGMVNEVIAYRLGTSEKTIKVHRARMMKKMGVRSVVELMRVTKKYLCDRNSDRCPLSCVQASSTTQ